MRRIAFILICIIIILIVVVVIFESYKSNLGKQEVVTESTAALLPVASAEETAPETTEAKTITSSETTISGTEQEITEDTGNNLPTLKLVINEGPIIVQDGELAYYRVKAIAGGEPYPSITFSKDDSNGTWGRNIAQVNLKNGESYTLVVNATNTSGTTTKSIELSWNLQ
jgi:hypothetical protein